MATALRYLLACRCTTQGFSDAALLGLQVTKASGQGPTLLLLPTPGTSFEAWRPLRSDDRSIPGFGFEGHHELLVHSRAMPDKGSWANV